jgi:LysR family transcriptional regulator, transcriptional activator of nhaA
MEWLNYHHLFYFWMVAKEGTIARACEKMRLAQPTISGQLRQLEESLGDKLFIKSGRTLALTETGQIVFRYAEEIFPVGHELLDVLRGRPQGRPTRFLVGISDAMPKLIAFRILQPVLEMKERVHLVCFEGAPEELLLKLSSHGLDMILTDAPVNAPSRARAFNHELGGCGVSFCASPALAVRFRKKFPASLEGAPFLLPLEGSTLRRSLDQWFEKNHIRPNIIGEFEDSALLKVFGQAGAGVFAVPTAVEQEVKEQHRSVVVGRTDEIRERFFAVSFERRLKHPAVVAISDAARQLLFPSESS